MTQKAMALGTMRAGTVKPRKSATAADAMTMTGIVVNVPQVAKQEYPEVNAAIDRGLADIAAGRVHTRRSYAEYADIEIED